MAKVMTAKERKVYFLNYVKTNQKNRKYNPTN